MWCSRCREDVPAVAGKDRGGFSCPRCGDVLAAGAQAEREREPEGTEAAPAAEEQTATASAPMPAYDSWELDERLRHIGRVLRPESPDSEPARQARQQEMLRIDAAHSGPSGWHLPEPPPDATPAKPSRKRAAAKPRARSSFSLLATIAWTILLFATTAIVCGGVLMGWSLLGSRPELWSIGLPVALGGQVALLVGLVLQMDRLRDEGRSTAERLHSVDEKLHELKTTTSLLGHGQNTPSGTFYAHLAEGAGPKLLLSDLKSQLDLLAWKMSREEG